MGQRPEHIGIAENVKHAILHRERSGRKERGMTWGDIYKQFTKEFPKAEATDYRPYVEGYLPFRRSGIIVWLKNGDVLAYFPKKDRKERS